MRRPPALADWSIFQSRGARLKRAIHRLRAKRGRNIKVMSTILLIILILLLVGALPSWPYSSGWGYYPSAGLGLVLLILVVLLLMGRI